MALKAGFWYVISTFLVKAISFITTPIFSRLMDNTSYGEFSNYASWQGTLLIITGAELYNTLSRAYYDYKEDYDKYVSSVAVFSCILTASIYVMFLLCGSWLYKIVSIPPQFVHIMFFTLTFQSCKQIYLAKERTLYRYKSVAAISFISLIVPTLISVVLVILAPAQQRLGARIYGFYTPWSVIGLVCLIVMLLRGRSFRWSHCKYAITLSLPLMVHYLTAYLLTSTNTTVTKGVLGAETTAVVSIATSAVNILTILFHATSGALTTWLMDNLEQKKNASVRRGLLFYVLGVSAVSLGVILMGPELIWILGGRKYAASLTLLPGMVVAVTIQSLTTVFTIILTYRKRVAKTAIYTAVVAGISITGKILLLPVFGVEILPWINIIAFGSLFFINYLLVRKTGDAPVINLKIFCFCILLLALLIVLSGHLYAHSLVRYAIICCAAISVLFVAYKKRSLIIKLLKKKLKK